MKRSRKDILTITLNVCRQLADNLTNGGALLSKPSQRNVSAN